MQSGMLFFLLQNHSVYDSTQFDTNATPINPLYAASLQSPDSITGYSIDSQEAQNPANGYQQWIVAHTRRDARLKDHERTKNLDIGDYPTIKLFCKELLARSSL